jgi:hypothetical protein
MLDKLKGWHVKFQEKNSHCINGCPAHLLEVFLKHPVENTCVASLQSCQLFVLILCQRVLLNSS